MRLPSGEGVSCCDVCSIGLPNLIVNRLPEINLIGNKHYSFDFNARKSDTSGMNAQDLLEYFGTKAAIARALGVSSPSVAEWFDPGIGVPEGRQYQAQIATKGKLKADLPALRKKAA